MSEPRTVRVGVMTDSGTLTRYIHLGLDASRFSLQDFDSTDPGLLDSLNAFAPDVLLIKKELRVGDGIDLRENLRLHGLATRAVIMSAHLETVKRAPDPDDSADSPTDYYLHIPFNNAILRKIIHRLTARENTIVYAEDSLLLHKILVPYLSSRGLRVLAATDGLAALAILEREQVDLVVSDVEMPEIDGFEFCRRVRADDRFKDIPFIITSGRDADNDIRRGFLVGVNDYITKPFLGLELLQRIEMHLGRGLEGPRRPERILVVDDHQLTREIIVEALGTNGFHPEQAGSASEALERLAGDKFDLLVSAAHLADEGEVDLLERIRRNQETRALPIIVTTMSSEEKPSLEETVRMESLGIEGVIGVPFNFSELLAIVERVLAFQRLESTSRTSPLLQ